MNSPSRILVRLLTCLVLALSTLPGLFQIAESLSGRATLVSGPVGTLTPTDTSSCNRGGCSLEGTFVSDDGTITLQEVVLSRDALRLRRSDPLPGAIDDVRLDTSASRPIAYTADYSWQWAMAKGFGAAVFAPVMLVFAVLVYRRRRARAHARTRDARW